MRLLTIAAATLALSFGTAALAASADDSANLYTCSKLASEVNQALATNGQSPGYDAAAKEKGYGRDFCANGLYKQGVTHYAQALKLLGSDKASSS